MATFNVNEADNYGGNGGGSFFSLKNDKDTAKVRFLYNTVEDVKGYSVHEIEIDGKKRYVNCLRAYNDPIEKCPFCEAQSKVLAKLFLKLSNEDAGECQIWERSKAYFGRLSGLSARYNPLVNEIVEIERVGKAGDVQTKYEFYPIESSVVNLDDYDCPEPLGTIILDKTEEDMRVFLDTGKFPVSENAEKPAAGRDVEKPEGRRTPANKPARRAF